MKKKLFILISLFTALTFFSCEMPVSLGSILDLEGPVVEITAPVPRKAVPASFILEGTISDESIVKLLLITVSMEGKALETQWRYNIDKWEISYNFGVNWTDYNVEGLIWDKGEVKINWILPVDLTKDNTQPEDGEYLFSVQAWDIGDMTDDKSFSSRVFIFDKDPPKVDISSPVLYRGKDAWKTEPLKTLHEIKDDGLERYEPSNIGKFLTQGFSVMWQVEDNHDVRSVDFLFYKYDEEIDGDTETPYPQNYIYRYFENIPQTAESIKPNGKFEVPALDGNGIPKPLKEKTTVMVVAVCYDAAGNVNQEKIIGYFIYWSLADEPWIIFSDGMEEPDYYVKKAGLHGSIEDILKEEAFMIFPGRTIRAIAYHNHGVEKVNFDLYSYDEKKGFISDKPISGLGSDGRCTFCGNIHSDKEQCFKLNEPRPNGNYSTIFPFEFRPPPRSGFFVIKAIATSRASIDSERTRKSQEHVALFRVQDISFPDFPEPLSPNASDPLFMHVDVDETSNTFNTVTISGIVRDATQVENLDMVWINPESAGFATQNQIRFFREPEFEGWQKIEELTNDQTSINIPQNSTFIEEDFLEQENIKELQQSNPSYNRKTYPNKLWRLKLNYSHEDAETQRQVFKFSITINLNDFNIRVACIKGKDCGDADNAECLPGKGCRQPLKSQVFLFKAKNPDNRTTIITYAPQGDESPPDIKISDVTIGAIKYTPQEFAMISRFLGGEKISINGTWHEDSGAYLPINKYFSDNFKVSINTISLTDITVRYNNHSQQSTDGTWTAVVEVGNGIEKSALNDSLVVAAETRDFGGNVSEAGGSWLVESDDLRLLRISSNDDGTFRQGQKITIFLEFSKAVQLRYSESAPSLILNSNANARAIYKPNLSQSTRQEFEYTVGQNHTTTRLNVTGIDTGIAWNSTTSNYPFTWVRGSADTKDIEEIRVTMLDVHASGQADPEDGPAMPSGRLYARRLPVTTNLSHADYMYTLAAGKNIRIDTQAPTITGIENTISGTNPVHFSSGDVFIRVKFSEPIMIGTTAPQLQLRLHNNRTVTTSSNLDDVRISGSDITFKYTIVAGDTTGSNPIIVTGITGGAVTDLAGTPYSATFTTTNITNRFINTLAPDIPVIRLFSTEVNAGSATNANSITNNVNGTTNYGRSNEATNRALSNVYHQNLFIAVQSNNSSVTDTNSFTGNNNLMENTGLEYSVVDSATKNWIKVPTANMGTIGNSGSAFSNLLPGTYRLVARQQNRAGIYSAQTPEITFTWDPGQLITRVSSATANGTYTHTAGRNEIAITVYFRKPVSIAAGSTITLNARRGTPGSDYLGSNPQVTLTGAAINEASSITYTYTIENGDNTPTGNTLLDVTAINITAWDGTTSGNGVRNDLTSMAHLTVNERLNGNKQFTVSTGNLTNTSPVFITDSSAGTGYNDQTNSNFHGIRTDDGSYWTTLEIPFNRPVSKGEGSITIVQNSTGYRVPSVLTEAQYNLFRSKKKDDGNSILPDIDTYYFRGTNGYINGQGSDISTKYVLQYNYNPTGTVNGSISGDTAVASTFISNFREAEKIVIPVAAQAVTIDGNKVKIRLSGSNAPQVPGATYLVSYPPGFVQDALGNKNDLATDVNVTLRGVAKPFVRIKKTQDTITENASSSMTQPRLVAAQPFQAYVRMDTRTPGAKIRHTVGEWSSATTGNNWSSGSGPTDTGEGAARPTAPTASTAESAAEITLGDTNYQGYQWWAVAIATTDAASDNTSTQSDEMAFRTVITYQLRNGTNAITADAGQSIMESGDQIWLRGGDAIGSSSIPGFPFTWEENWSSLKDKRAGIRLMTKVETSTPTTVTTISNVSFGNANNNTNYRYTATDKIGDTGLVMPVTVNGQSRFLRVESGSGNTFRLYTSEPNATTQTIGNGVTAGTGVTTLTVTGPAKLMDGANVLDQNTYVGVTTPGATGTTFTVTVDGQTRYVRSISNTNRTFKIFDNETDANSATATAGTGIKYSSYPISTVSVTYSNLNNSVWKFVTWDINTTAYVDFIRGRDVTEGTYTASTANVAWQYGPRRWAYQRAGWTSAKYQYPIYPGKHRWCDAGQDHMNKGAINFSGTFSARDGLSADYNTWPGINTP